MGKKAKKVQEVQKVSIESSDDAAYATIIRSMLTATRAAKKLGAYDKMKDMLAIESWASGEFKKAVI